MPENSRSFAVIASCLAAAFTTSLLAQSGQVAAPEAVPVSPAPSAAPVSVETPGDYVVGVEDVLGVVFWRDQELSADVVVRPDGKISLPLLNDVDVVGLTPDQVRGRVVELAKRFVDEPSATVVVKQINSRKVFITGQVERPGTFSIIRPTSVLQLIALAGGLKEFANAGDIVVIRHVDSRQLTFPFNYNDLKNRRNLSQNIELKPGDTVIVP